MPIDFGAPRALWLLGLLPLVWWAGQIGVRLRPRPWPSIARALLLACLIGGLAQPTLSFRASRTARIYVVDASHSVSAQALDSVASAIDAMNLHARPDWSRILAFAGGVATVADTAALRRLATSQGQEAMSRSIVPDATNIEQALGAASAEVPPGADGQVVLFTDGHETDGDTFRAGQRLGATGVPVFAQPLPVRDIADTWIEEIRLSSAPAAGAPAHLEIVVGSQVAGPADILLREGTRTLGRVRATVTSGVSNIPVDASFDAPGVHLVEAVVTAEHDALAENNTLSREVVVEPRLRLLYVHPATGDAGVAPRALSNAGVQVTTVRPEALPGNPAALDRWDVIALSNVGDAAVSPEAMKAIGDWVEQRGGGLLFVGGNAVFGEGLDAAHRGYRYTDIERILPVTFDRDDEPSVALVIVLDRSWSMRGAAMELSKTAAEGAANALAPFQMLGVLTFNNAWNWDIPLGRVRDSRPGLHQAIASITASGPTAIYPALGAAYGALSGVRARAKHVVLLSDGQSDPQDFEGLVRKMAAARITVSTVALGPDADVTLLRSLSTWGGGRSYVVQDAEQVPEIFVKEARNAGVPAAKGGDGTSVGGTQPLPFFDVPTQVPAVAEHNTVTRKPQAIEWLPAGTDPLLTIWPAGLGRTAMFAADLDGRWTADWMRWPRLAGFLSGVVRSLAPRRLPPWSLNLTPGEKQGAHSHVTVSLAARDREVRVEAPPAAEVEVRSAADQLGTVALSRVAPGRYEAQVVVDTTRPLTFTASGPPAAAGVSRILTVDPAREYRFGTTDEARLAALARVTGGTLRPSYQDLTRRPSHRGQARHALAPWLLALALALWPVDIVLRRFQR